VSSILVAADAKWIRDLVKSACTRPGQRVLEATKGQDVRIIVGAEAPDVVVLDSQIQNMGGIAAAIDLRLEAAAGRITDVAILLLLDREADRFLAKRADADAELVKPVDAATLRRVIDTLLQSAPATAAATTADDEAPGEVAADAPAQEPEPVEG
jgi:DNA-binding response OmpR family regulator